MRVRARCEVCGVKGALCEVVRLIWGRAEVLCCPMCAGDYHARGLAA